MDRWRRSTDALHSAVGGSTVVLHLKDGTYYELEGVGGLLWTLLETPHSKEDLITAILADHDASRADVARDVDAFLADLETHGLAMRE